ncbi:MupG family TIM beta-alpha barrel fold protein [Streptococcus gallolyticus]|uniref:DUF871 domain-containing protein n=1 Tax=Streptococcus hepaticus TaxID=3349163 RepID=UPI001C9880F3|nr:MupG family TIM beta-alpha barrel fold protein [Streptococcus gallolyticus]MBY5041577.1 MupG family TIM beta-alpha barrel fold protein [Streptococcus gallolyticus]
MPQLGFSLYPEGYQFDELKAYIDLLKSYNSKRVFISLLQLLDAEETIFDLYRWVVAYCKEIGLEVFADLNPKLIKHLGWQDHLLESAESFGLAGIRLDETDEDQTYLVNLTRQSSPIKIEVNMSGETSLIKDLVAAGADLSKVTACHNFYPHEFTGLSKDYFLKVSQVYRELGVETAAFINAQSADIGPWPLSEGLCTLEEHRHLSLNAQYKWLAATGLIDHIIIANQFVSQEELASLRQQPSIEFDIKINREISSIEKEIIQESHNYRGDISEYVVRSTGHRGKYSQKKIPPIQQKKCVKRGHILIDNQLYTRYCGELQIALCDFTVSEKVNIVGHIIEEDYPLLDLLQPWQDFILHIV